MMLTTDAASTQHGVTASEAARLDTSKHDAVPRI
jgi:hypothetical protein